MLNQHGFTLYLWKKNYSSQTWLMYNSVPVSNESFVQGGKG